MGVVLAIGLHAGLLFSVQVTASKSSSSEVAFIPAAVMAVRDIEAQPPAAALPEVSVVSQSSPAAAAPVLPVKSDSSVGAGAVTASPLSARAATPAPNAAASEALLKPVPPTTAALTAPVTLPAAAANELPAAPQYRAAGSLDPGPKPLSDINPDYPARAGQQQGIVVLRLLINEQGVVDNVAVVRATPLGYFEESALEAFGKALFSPGKLLGVAVKSQITIEVEFMPINRGATVSGRTY
jgi:periplasmic protein TonB